MENASKALIIAGAILLAIVIISLGLIVINNTRNTVDNANTNEQEIQVFNAKFTPFVGTGITKAQVSTLCQTVIASNQKESNLGTTNSIAVYNCKSTDNSTTQAASKKISGTTGTVSTSWITETSYTVEATYNNNTGRIEKLYVYKP